MRHCWFKRYARDECRWRHDGQADPCHLIPKQRIKSELRALGLPAREIKDAVWDERLVVPGCRHHHDAFDGKRLPLLEDDYPPALRDWAADNDFVFIDARTGWIAVVTDTGGAAA